MLYNKKTITDPVTLENIFIGEIIKINPTDDVIDSGNESDQYFLYNSSDDFDDVLKLYMDNYSLYESRRLSINFNNEFDSDNELEPPEEPCISILGSEYKIDDYLECLSDLI